MATRTYKNSSDFDVAQAHFTIEAVDDRYYLKIGALSSADQQLVESLIPDGYVGFFQDDARISIAEIISTYDSETARIEIKDLTTELTVEAEYVIRFTQARPGEDGEGGISTPGTDGWSPEFSTVSDGSRRVHRIVDWHGGSGDKPDTGAYIGATGFVSDIKDAVNIRGPAGEDGDDAGLLQSSITTRGPLVARSGTIPRELNGNWIDGGSWTLGTINSDGSGIPNTFGALDGYLRIPQEKPYTWVNGLWVVATRGNVRNPTQLDEAFMLWGPGAIDESRGSGYDTQRANLQFAHDAHLRVAYYQGLDSFPELNEPRIIIQGFGDRLPANNCRVWVYLGGFFIS